MREIIEDIVICPNCEANIKFYNGRRGESAWEMWRRLGNEYPRKFFEYIDNYENVKTDFARLEEQEAIKIMQQIEKDLNAK